MTKILHDCSLELKDVSLHVTPARIAAMKLFESHDTPVDVQHVIDHLQKNLGVDRVTVFRIINTFVEKGILRKLEFQEGKSRYELANKEDHHHLICERCGEIEDVADTVIPSLVEQIKKNQQFIVTKHSLEFFGICKHCQK